MLKFGVCMHFDKFYHWLQSLEHSTSSKRVVFHLQSKIGLFKLTNALPTKWSHVK